MRGQGPALGSIIGCVAELMVAKCKDVGCAYALQWVSIGHLTFIWGTTTAGQGFGQRGLTFPGANILLLEVCRAILEIQAICGPGYVGKVLETPIATKLF